MNWDWPWNRVDPTTDCPDWTLCEGTIIFPPDHITYPEFFVGVAAILVFLILIGVGYRKYK